MGANIIHITYLRLALEALEGDHYDKELEKVEAHFDKVFKRSFKPGIDKSKHYLRVLKTEVLSAIAESKIQMEIHTTLMNLIMEHLNEVKHRDLVPLLNKLKLKDVVE